MRDRHKVMGGKRGYKKGKKGTPEVLASQHLECRDSLGRVVQQVQCQGRGKCDEKARGGSGQEKLGRVLSRERRRRRGRKVLFSCVTFCASEIMGDHCPIRQSRGPKGTPARPGSSSSSLLHSLFPPSLLPPSSSCQSTATSRRPLRSLPAAPFAHTHTCPFVRSVPLTVVHLPPQTSSSSILHSPFCFAPSLSAVKRPTIAPSPPCSQSLDTATCCASLSSVVPLPASRSRSARSHHHSLCPSATRVHSLQKSRGKKRR